jgi:hypothetical protein
MIKEARCGCKGCARAREEGKSDFAQLIIELANKELNKSA